MNLFNRVFTVTTLLVLIPLAAIAMVAPQEGVDSLAGAFASLQDAPFGRLLLIIAAGVVIVLCFALLYLEIRPTRRTTAIVGRMEGGATAEIAIDAISQRLRREVLALSDVEQVEPHVVPRRNGVDIRLTIFTSPDVDVPAKATEVGRVVRENVEQRMGLRVRKVSVNIKHHPFVADTAPSAAH